MDRNVLRPCDRLAALAECKACVPPAFNSFTLADIDALYDALLAQKRERFLFHDGSIGTRAQFRHIVLSEDVWAYAGFAKDTREPMALVLVDKFFGRAAFLHFTFFQAGTAHRHALASAFLDVLFQDREQGLSCVCGLTPLRFRHAWKFALETGFVKLGVLPGVCPVLNRKTGEMEFGDGVFTVFNPKESA